MNQQLPRDDYWKDVMWGTETSKKYGISTYIYRSFLQRLKDQPREYMSTGIAVSLDHSSLDENNDVDKACLRIVAWYNTPAEGEYDKKSRPIGNSINIPLDSEKIRELAASLLEVADGLDEKAFSTINSIYS